MGLIFFAAGMGAAMYVLGSKFLHLVLGFYVGDSSGSTVELLAVVVAVVNAIGGLIVFKQKLPYMAYTLGPYLFILNALALIIGSFLVPVFSISGFMPLIIPAAILAVVGVLLKFVASKLFTPRKVPA